MYEKEGVDGCNTSPVGEEKKKKKKRQLEFRIDFTRGKHQHSAETDGGGF